MNDRNNTHHWNTCTAAAPCRNGVHENTERPKNLMHGLLQHKPGERMILFDIACVRPLLIDSLLHTFISHILPTHACLPSSRSSSPRASDLANKFDAHEKCQKWKMENEMLMLSKRQNQRYRTTTSGRIELGAFRVAGDLNSLFFIHRGSCIWSNMHMLGESVRY